MPKAHNRYLLLLPLVLTACQNVPKDGYANPGDPERQLVITTEITSIELQNENSLNKLKESIRAATPKTAQLACTSQSTLCNSAKSVLMNANIPLEIKPPNPEDAQDTVTLTYEHLAASMCDARYKDNAANSANTGSAQIGCSIRSNMMHMVSDKQQFSNPSMLDYTDGEKAAKNYQNYLNPPAQTSTASGGSATQSLIGAGSGQ